MSRHTRTHPDNGGGSGHARRAIIRLLGIVALAAAIVLSISLSTNTTAPKWDALHYLDIARHGIVDNPRLVAPFAYRPGMPYISAAVAAIFDVSLERGFAIVGLIAATVLLVSAFALARVVSTTDRSAVVAMLVVGLSYFHVKFPLFFSCAVDVAAYPLAVVAFWALATHRARVCLAVSAVGVFFKEFLAVPLVLLCVQLGVQALRERSVRAVTSLCVTIAVAAGAVLIPRYVIPVSGTVQFVDPLRDTSTLARLVTAPLDGDRIINIGFAVVAYWLPAILLMTRARCEALWETLRSIGAGWLCVVYVALILVLTMYGGTNIPIFVSYMVPVQIMVVASLCRGSDKVEIVYVCLAMAVFNRIFVNIPDPDQNFDAYVDFYGGWSSRVNDSTYKRMAECVAWIVGGVVIKEVRAWRAGAREA